MNELTGLAIEQEQGPSWARPNWPVAELDPVNVGLDPTEATIEKPAASEVERVAEQAKAAIAAAGVTDEAAIRRAAEDSIRAMMLIRTYRVRGHLAANLDPLGLVQRELPADLTPPITASPMPISTGRSTWAGRLVSNRLRSARYCRCCRPITAAPSASNMHINDLEERRFLQDRMEGKDAAISFTPEGKRSILEKVIHGEQWEKFLARKYVGTKRFGLDGGERYPRA
jgi:2-oxoglutarate dehydrogenase E1 component